MSLLAFDCWAVMLPAEYITGHEDPNTLSKRSQPQQCSISSPRGHGL
jgi:hypothetical protein